MNPDGTMRSGSSGPGIVIVGASLSGLHTAQSLRQHGYRGPLRLIGNELGRPYDRPPLSKQVFRAPDLAATRFELPGQDSLSATWHLGVAATELDTYEHRITLSDGSVVDFEALVIATGTQPRRLGFDNGTPDGVLTLRTRADAVRLRSVMASRGHLVIIGGGFMGSELASAAAEAGHRATLLMRGAHPLARCGEAVGSLVGAMHHDAGVTTHTNLRITGFTRRTGGALTGVRTSRGWIPADVVVAAIGDTPNTGWLAGSGLVLDPGVRADPQGRVLRHDGVHLPRVLAVGDVVNRPHPLAGGLPTRIPHWSNAVETGTAAGRLLASGRETEPRGTIPSFWSDIHGSQIRSVGLPSLADGHTVTESDPDRRRLVVEYRRGASLIGALTVNRTSRLVGLRSQIEHDLTGREAHSTSHP